MEKCHQVITGRLGVCQPIDAPHDTALDGFDRLKATVSGDISCLGGPGRTGSKAGDYPYRIAFKNTLLSAFFRCFQKVFENIGFGVT